MNKNKSKFILILLLLLSVGVIFTIAHNYYNDERNVYIAFFSQFDLVPNMKDVVFISSTTNCDSKKIHIKEASESLFNNFINANNNTEPYDITPFSSMVNVVSWKETKLLHNSTTPPQLYNLKLEKEVVEISRIGFNEIKDKALFCVRAKHLANIYLYKKTDNKTWKLVKYRNLWVS